MKPLITLKLAEAADSSLLFAWRNHPDIYRYSKNARSVTLEEHSDWFAESLKNSDRIIFIAYSSNEPIGMIRLDFTSKISFDAEISIYVSPQSAGQGFGSRLLEVAEKSVREIRPAKTFVAEVRQDNVRSLRLFSKMGYQQVGTKKDFVLFKKFLD